MVAEVITFHITNMTSSTDRELTKSTTQRAGALPKFWREALEVLRTFNFTKADPRRWTVDDARAHPIWVSPIFEIRHRSLVRCWREHLEFNSAKDAVKTDGSAWTDDEILEYFEERFEQSSRGDFYVSSDRLPVTRKAALKNWHAVLGDLPERLRSALREDQGELWRYSKKALTIMKSMGWKGGGLGRHEDGRSEPVTVRAPPKNARAGLGSTRTRAKPDKARDKLRVVVHEGDRFVYGYPNRDGMEEALLTVKGLARRTGAQLYEDFSDMREVMRWAGRVLGPAESTFPHPKEWRLEGIDTPLDRITVKLTTCAITERTRVPPSCLAAWEARIGALPSNIGERYNIRLLTPKDWTSHFKNVLHRAMRVNGNDPHEKGCRCCKHAYENLQHFATCDVVGTIFDALAALIAQTSSSLKLENMRDKERFALFCVRPDGQRIEEGWINFHLLLWKQIIYALVQVTTEDQPFKPHSIWGAAWTRFQKKALAKHESIRTVALRDQSRGNEPKDLSPMGAPMAPIASTDSQGDLIWNSSLVDQIEKLQRPPPRPPKSKKRRGI